MEERIRPWIKSYPKDVDQNIDIHPYKSLSDLFISVCNKHKDRVAFINMGATLTYGALYEQAKVFASYLQCELHLEKGDKIAIMMPNLLQYPVVLFGSFLAGLTVVNINPLYTPRELNLQFIDSDVSCVIALENCLANVEKSLVNTKVKHVIVTKVGDMLPAFKKVVVNFVVKYVKNMVPTYTTKPIWFSKIMARGYHEHFEIADSNLNDIAFLQYTGGTTGRAKGAKLTHSNIIANIQQAYGMYGSILREGNECIVTALPLYHIFAMTINCMLFVRLAATSLLITDPRDFKNFIKELKNHRTEITALTGVNTLFNALVNNEEFCKLTFPNLRIVIGGGAAVQSGVAKRFYEVTNLPILEGYGLTECSPLCCVNPPNSTAYSGTIGIPVPHTDAIIVDNEGNEIWDLNTPGELEIKGPQVMQGYYKKDKENLIVFDGDYVKTGDIAVWCDGGYIKIIDRIKDMILVSGFNVFPSEIEDVVSRLDKVLECAAVAIPSDKTGEAIKLIVVKKDPNLCAPEIITHCRKYLTGYKIPKVIEFTDDLPKTAVGKVLRRVLREREQKAIRKALEQQLHNEQ